MNLVSLKDMPKKVISIPLDNLNEIYKKCLAMTILCVKNEGTGLAAVQVGIPWNLFIAKENQVFDYYVECKYEPVDPETYPSLEGCLSLRHNDGRPKYFMVQRYKKIRFFGKILTRDSSNNLILKNIDKELEKATVLQHETDHAHDILISDFGTEIKR